MAQPTIQQTRGALCGLAAAALFGVSAPLAKVLLGHVQPVLLAGLLYLGAAAGLWLHRAVQHRSREASLTRADLPKLVAVVISGGILGPVLMLLGLQRVTALTGSLLLNLEGPFTALLAVLVFREHLGRRALLASACIFAGAGVLKLQPGDLQPDTTGLLLLAAACACWAIDNNFTQRLSAKDPFAIVRIKTLVAGTCNVVLGLSLAQGTSPQSKSIVAAMVLGSLSYGVSVVLDAYALRLIGAAREAAFFATAPFIGALMSLLLFQETLSRSDLFAMAMMGFGVVLLFREHHQHAHVHEPMAHEHLHTHDEHHRHQHGPNDPLHEPHSHWHDHERLVHDHAHVSDIHHRHRH